MMHATDGPFAPPDPWLNAIQDATCCLRERDASKLDKCLFYLFRLEAFLNKPSRNWDCPPRHPPPLSWHDLDRGGLGDWNYSAQSEIDYDDFDEEAGDYPVGYGHNQMDARRLLIRVLTSQSEVYATKATLLRQQAQWRQGAELYGFSLSKIHQAIVTADAKISVCLQQQEQQLLLPSDVQNLIQDANIVQVAIESLTVGRDKYLAAAQRQEHYLVRKLQPQWESRDQVKAKMGKDRWYNNPSPRNDHAKLRQALEEELRDIRSAMQQLQLIDTTQAERTTQYWKDNLSNRTTPPPTVASNSRVQSNDLSSSPQRYNGKRPTGLSKRVSWQKYPDPTEYGWKFTGSCDNVVEFFEKHGVKLDWYFTTATVKTALDHPIQGKTQLFGAKVDPATYRKILESPRVHTGNRYHKRNKGRKK